MHVEQVVGDAPHNRRGDLALHVEDLVRLLPALDFLITEELDALVAPGLLLRALGHHVVTSRVALADLQWNEDAVLDDTNHLGNALFDQAH